MTPAAGKVRHEFLCNILDSGSLVIVPLLVEMDANTWATVVVLALLSIVAFLQCRVVCVCIQFIY